MPDAVNRFCDRDWMLHYTQHAKREFIADKLGVTNTAPRFIHFSRGHAVEATLDENNAVVKLVVRVGYDKFRDLVLVLCGFSFEISSRFVKTVWTNRVSDGHSTLNRNVYATR